MSKGEIKIGQGDTFEVTKRGVEVTHPNGETDVLARRAEAQNIESWRSLARQMAAHVQYLVGVVEALERFGQLNKFDEYGGDAAGIRYVVNNAKAGLAEAREKGLIT